VEVYGRQGRVGRASARPSRGLAPRPLMIGTSFNPALKEANDLGTKGELPVVLESFQFGGA